MFAIHVQPDKGTRTRFRGLISQVTLWKHTIDTNTINLHMSDGIHGNERGIIGHWPMTEGVGDKIFDSSANKLHGTIVGAQWWMSSDSVGGLTSLSLSRARSLYLPY